MFLTVLFIIAKIKNQLKCQSTRCMNKENVVYTYTGIYSTFKKKEVLPFTITLMNLEDILLSESNQSQKGKYCMVSP